jgi:hypothetical protein
MPHAAIAGITGAKCFFVCLVLEMLTELARREKAANIKPDHDIDVYMKVRLLQITKSILCFKKSIYASIKQEGSAPNVDSHIYHLLPVYL